MQDIYNALECNIHEIPNERIEKIEAQRQATANNACKTSKGEMKEPSNFWGPRSDAKVIAVYNFKGGVGKTTLAANLAASLAQGLPNLFDPARVLLIDADAQANLTGFFMPSFEDLDLSSIGALHAPGQVTPAHEGVNPQVLASNVPNNAHVEHMDHLFPQSVSSSAPSPNEVSPLSVVGIFDLYTHLQGPMSGEYSQLKPPEKMFKCHPHIYGDRLLLVPGSGSLFELDANLIASSGLATYTQTHSVFSAWVHIAARAAEAQYVIIDLGPSNNRFNKMVLMSCDYILPPVFADFFSLNSVHLLLRTVLPGVIMMYDQLKMLQDQTRSGPAVTGIDLATKVALGLNIPNTFRPKLLPFIVTNYRTYGNAYADGPLSAPRIGSPNMPSSTDFLTHSQNNPHHQTAPKKLVVGQGKFVASMRNVIDNFCPSETDSVLHRVRVMMTGDPPNAVPGPDGTMFLQRSMVIPLIRSLQSLVSDSQYFGMPMVSMTEMEWKRDDVDNPGLNQIITNHSQDGQKPKVGHILSNAVVDHLYVRGRFGQLCMLIRALPQVAPIM